MYLSFFNLTCKPFDLVPNPEFIFLSKTHKKAITYLDYGIRERAGFVLLTGEVGSGKTTIIRELINKHLERVVLAKVFNTNVNTSQLLSMINDDFELPVQGKDKIELLRDLNHFLVEQYGKGNQPLLIIDEAQNLPPETLEEIRMLSNLETSDSKLLQIILVGQPELRTLLAKPELRQLRQRISIQCNLHPLNRQETEEYIFHRLQVAGNRDALSFAARALDLIFIYSCGIPRLINVFCDFLLLAAFAEGVRDVNEELTRDIAGDLDFDNHYWAGELPATVDSTSIAPADALHPGSFWSENRIEELFTKLSKRLEIHEKETLSAAQAPLNELNQRLEQLENSFTIQLNRANAAVATLNSKIEEMPYNLPVTQESPDKNIVLKPGLIRRIFG
ncbi:MAG: XrtA/PEP-CTERM system-associated ATPase [Desulfuromonadales bacterium]